MALADLPFRSWAIRAHRLPIFFLWDLIMLSSSVLHGALLIPGHKWFNHLSLTCFPVLPGSCLAIAAHAPGPISPYRSCNRRSSTAVHCFGFRRGFSNIVVVFLFPLMFCGEVELGGKCEVIACVLCVGVVPGADRDVVVCFSCRIKGCRM